MTLPNPTFLDSLPNAHFQIDKNTELDRLEYLVEVLSAHNGIYGDFLTYDILQQAIIIEHNSAVNFLLMKDVIPSTYHPACNGYLHLACKLGKASIVKTIMECRSTDFYVKSHACYPGNCFASTSEGAKQTSKSMIGLSPIDIATANSQRDCLLALLHSLPIDNHKNYKPAAFLCDIDHARALELYLKGPVDSKDLKDAYQLALLKKRDLCLEVLFKYGFREFDIRGMNPFHYLYQYSDGYNQHSQRHDRLSATTACLLKYGADPKAFRPAGSYPLYSLLDLIMKDAFEYGEEYWSESVSRELLSCLKLILRQGVRLDLDEEYVMHSRQNEDEPVAFGRKTFNSVYDVISRNASSAFSCNLAASEILRDCINILLEQPKPVILKPSHLSGIMVLLTKSLKSRSTAKNIEEVVMKLLWAGIDPSKPMLLPYGIACSYTKAYLLNQYIEALCDIEPLQSNMKLTLNENPVVRWLANLMTYPAMCTSMRLNMQILSSAKYRNGKTKLTDSFVRFIISTPMLRLKTLAAKQVWVSIKRDKSKLCYLPIPKHLQNSLLEIIIKEI